MSNTQARLLIVDDETPLMTALCDTLQPQGYVTRGFTSAREALEALRAVSFDLILTDLMMPEMNGISVLNEAFEIDPALVGIVMTGHGSVDTAVEALKTGAVDYILKPFKFNAILAVLARALAVRRLRLENIGLRETVGLHELNVAIASARDSDVIVQKLADAAFQQARAEGLGVVLFSEATASGSAGGGNQEWVVAAVRGSGWEGLAGQRLTADLAGPDWNPAAAGFSADAELAHRELAHRPAPIGGLPPGLSIPMHYGGKLIGILHFLQEGARGNAAAIQLKALGLLASTGASALAAAFGVERLRAAEDRYRRLAEDAPDVVSRFDLLPTPRCSYINPAILECTGYAPAEFYADPALILNITHAEDRDQAMRALRGELASGCAELLRWVSRSGEVVWVEQRSAHVFDRQGQLAAIESVSRDITERRKLEDQLRHSQKLEAIGKLTAGVAHDFNNLLTVINGYSALALGEVSPSSPTFRKLTEIKNASDQAANMTNRLLTFSRKQVVSPRTIDLGELMVEMEGMIQRLAGDTVAVRLTCASNLDKVKMDPTLAQQVVLNLTANARDAMGGVGKLDFDLSNSHADRVRSMFPEVKPGRFVMLTITDNGCGMPAEVKERAFEPFFTTKEIGRGTGLGLATVKSIVEQCSGHIHLDSAPGRGTRFTILLPCSCERVSETGRETAVSPAHQATILLVEDEDVVRALCSQVLSFAGHTVVEASDGCGALKLAAEHAGSIQLLITDLNLPGISGVALAQRLRGMSPGIKVLITSGYTEIPGGPAELTPPAEFLRKPFTPADLSKAVAQILESPAAGNRAQAGAS
jgi:PAS domain S-box-containing protein